MSGHGTAADTKRRGGRAVQSRYLQCDRKRAEDVSASSSSLCAAGLPSGAKAKSGLSQKCETSAGVGHSLLSQSNFERGDLQSTLLDEENIKQPDLDLSPINDKPVHRKSVSSESAGDAQITKARAVETDSNDQIEELESETLLFTYLRLKVGKNVAELEKNAEKNLIMLLKEKQRQQEKLWKLKREIVVQEWKQKLRETLDKQIEVLSPLVPVCERLKEQYKSFAASLDATRHELPIKNIHIEGDKQTYLDKLGKELRITQELLTEIMPSHSEECAKALPALKELKEVYQKLNKELQRSFIEVENLSSEVSKEVSLHNQNVCEEKHGLDVVKRWYFN
ncbi:HAUS augmin-like complex subunit 8 isoform X1 [Pithys albifrons albifrons]|uniref:HAUS augmin-like complex subunit 8 isoform X1 n=1 Tax=Pithys albifrons albifrons TaxID=3385563 RepID=UPI003A5CA90F